MKFVGFVTAKGRSRGLPGKNCLDLCGKPLVAWSMEAGKSSKLIDDVFVSTDSDRVKEISRNVGVQIISRPLGLCEDNTTSDAVIAHAIPHMKEFLKEENFGIVLLQPTSPLRTSEDIDNSIQAYIDCGVNALVSVVRQRSDLLKAYKQDTDGFLTGAFSPDAPYMPRQSLPRIFMPNGAIYIFSADDFISGGCIPRSRVIPYVMSRAHSVDIDSEDDLNLAKKYIEERNRETQC